jgi:hypothetical protein
MFLRSASIPILALSLTLVAYAQEGFQSGLQPAPKEQPFTKIPQSFEAHIFNGKYENRFHDVVSESDYFPTVLLFVNKQPAEGKEAPLKNLLAKLDELIEKYQPMDQYPEVSKFAVYAIFLDPTAQTSLTKEDVKDPAALVKEATERRTLYAKMTEWAKPIKKVVIGTCVPESVDKYKLNPDAEFTMLYYESFNVLDNWAYGEGKFAEENIAPIIAKLDERLQAKIAWLEMAKRRKLKAR